jgi:carbonic anhydrase
MKELVVQLIYWKKFKYKKLIRRCMKVSIFSKAAAIFFYSLVIMTPICNAQLTPQEGLLNLKTGNKEFASNAVFTKQRQALIQEQNPSYVVLSCSDSRTTPEYIFNQPLGNVFSVRTAGHVIDNVAIDTIEYAITHFDVVNLIVMGHQNCGAVDGALKKLKEDKGKILNDYDDKDNYENAVLRPIEKAIIEHEIDIHAHDALEKSTIANVRYVSDELQKRSLIIHNAIKNNKINLIGSVYSLQTGKVDFSIIK